VDSLEEAMQALREERRDLISKVLGHRQPDLEAEAASRRESYAGRYDWLPADTQTRLMELEEQHWQQNHAHQVEISKRDNPQWTQEDHARRKELQDEFQRARKETLGELAGEFDLRNSIAGIWAKGLAGFEPTETEWRAVATAKADLEKARRELQPAQMDIRMMMRYGLIPKGFKVSSESLETTPEEAEARRQKLEAWSAVESRHEAAVKDALGAERHSEYQRAKDGDYQQTRRVTQRLGLNDSVAAQAWEIQRAAQAAAEQLRVNGGVPEDRVPAALLEIQAEAERSLRATLGSGFDVYHEYAGGWLNGIAPAE
jgi:hypothetical protein